ncbi:MAG: hypothetical protein F2563_05145 [Actinobacteria bacterium]|uniref:Unannotated protein n=1 Tax=freshwater metagenome TaxID=449393 RepID=A0A6J6F4T0_9ZZZZ|nr:hypothetical protein [Actinomycetota bacterium]
MNTQTPEQIHTELCRKPEGNYFTWSIPDNSKVKIHGFPMLKKLEDGKTFIVKRDEANKIYWFHVPRTGKKVIGHFMDSVDHGLACFPRGDNNCIQVVG